MKKNVILTIAILTLLLSTACMINISSPQTVRGSGKTASETRPLSGFTAIELTGSADVIVSLGETETVTVEADDNILPLVTTTLRGDTLVIGLKPMLSISPDLPVRVIVTLKELQAASLPGSGNITISGLNAGSLQFDLLGSGNITATGAAEAVNVNLGGSGNVLCGELLAKAASVKILGSGNVTVYASERLDASINGSGNVSYRGSPAQVNQSVGGSGSIQAEP